MKLSKKKIISAGIAALVIISCAVILFFKEFNTTSTEKLLKIMSEHVDLEVRNVLYREVGGEDSKWEIRAKKASYMKKSNQALFENVEVKVFLSDGRTVLLAGDKGELNTATKDIAVSGNVTIDAGGEERFASDNLRYSYAEKRVSTAAPVLMETSRMSITGEGMSFSLKNRKLVLLSKVHAHIIRVGKVR